MEALLGIDYGEANIGLAYGREGLVTPIRVISGKNEHTAISTILRVVEEYDIDRFILGLPLTLGDRETPKSQQVRRFARLLKSKSKLPLDFVSEFHTSKDAAGLMLSSGVSQKGRRIDDHYAASLILKRYFRQKSED